MFSKVHLKLTSAIRVISNGTDYLAKIDFTTPLSINVPYIFFNIIKIIGPSSNPNIPINLKPVYIAINVNIG